MCEETTTVTSGSQRRNSNPATSRANDRDQDRLDSRSLDGMQEVTRGASPRVAPGLRRSPEMSSSIAKIVKSVA
jgi:hypothetical protein